MEPIIKNSLENSCTYQQYRKIVSDLLSEGKVTGDVQSKDLVHYTLLNETRMNRLERTISILPEHAEVYKSLTRYYIMLVISEGWCGDSAQLIPILRKIEKCGEKNIRMRLVFRDANPQLMDLFLTAGSRSVPKAIFLEQQSLKVLAQWGPRPKGAAEVIKRYKAAHGVVDEAAKTELQLWYLHDKGHSTQSEIAAIFRLLEQDAAQSQ